MDPEVEEPVPYQTKAFTAARMKAPETLLPDPQTSLDGKALSLSERAILDAHFAAIGGVQHLTQVKSIRMKGRLQLPDGQEQELLVVKKSGEKIRISRRMDNWHRTAVVTPVEDWFALWKDGELKLVEDLDPLERSAMMRYPHVKNELLLALENSWKLHYNGLEPFEGVMAHSFEVEMSPGQRARFYLDPESLHCLGRDEFESQPDGSIARVRSVFEQYTTDPDGYLFPTRTTTLINGQLRQILTITEMETNPGVLDSIFQRPQG